MPRFVIHVGPHKTGTTYIQAHLKRYRERLKDDGIYYPTQWCSDEVDWCHYDLFKQIRGKQWSQVEGIFSELKSSKFHTIVISSEDLSSMSVDELGFLAYNAGENVQVVYYLRRWVDLLPSNAQEDIRHGSTATFSEIILKHMIAPYRSAVVNYMIKLDRLSAAFGLGNMRIVLFDNFADTDKNLFAHFLKEVLRSSLSLEADPAAVHKSVSPIELEFLRCGNYLRSKGLISNRLPWGAFLARIRKLDTGQLTEIMQKNIENVIIDERDEPFSSIYSHVAENYGRAVIGPALAGGNVMLFKQSQKAIPYVHPNYLYGAGVVDMIYDICGASP